MLKTRGIFYNLLLVFILISILTGCTVNPVSTSSYSSKTVNDTQVRVLRYSHPTSTQDDIHIGAEFFARRVKELTSGSLEIKVYPTNEMGSPQEVAEQVIKGSIDICNASGGQIQMWVPQFAAIQLPFQFKSVEQAYRVLDNEGGEMLAKLAREKGFEVLTHWELGFRIISNSARPINAVEDLKGLKLRVPPEIPMEACMRAVGVLPTQISWPETYNALARKIVDGQENPLRYIYTNDLYKVQKYLAIPGCGYMYQSYPHVVSIKTWNSLKKTEQDAIRKASVEARDFIRNNVKETEKRAIEEMQKSGIIFTRPNPEPFRQKMLPAYETISDYTGKDFVKVWSKIVDKYE